MYAPNAVLLPSASNNAHTSRAEIVDYFKSFLPNKPQGVIEESYVSAHGAIIIIFIKCYFGYKPSSYPAILSGF